MNFVQGLEGRLSQYTAEASRLRLRLSDLDSLINNIQALIEEETLQTSAIQHDQQEQKPLISMHPLNLEQALPVLLQVKPEKARVESERTPTRGQ